MFIDRADAGAQLASAIGALHLRAPVMVLGLPRGGVPIGREIARILHAPLDVMVVRKIGRPGQPEYAIGAIAPGNVVVSDRGDYVHSGGAGAFERLARTERVELRRRERVYRAGRPSLQLSRKTIVLADDGIATGLTMVAAARAARRAGASMIIAAAPVASSEGYALVTSEVDKLIVLKIPPVLSSIGEWYERFDQLEDAEVCELLESAAEAKIA